MSEFEPRRNEILDGGDVVAAYMKMEAAVNFAMRTSGELLTGQRELKERVEVIDINPDIFDFDAPIPAGLIVEATPGVDLGDLTIQEALAWKAVGLFKEKQIKLLKERLMPEDAPKPVIGITKVNGNVFSLLDSRGGTRHIEDEYLEGEVTKLEEYWLVLKAKDGNKYLVEPRRGLERDQVEAPVQIVILEN